MLRLLKPLFSDSSINTRLLSATVFVHLLGLATTFYSMLVFSRYLSHGIDSTLITLTVGAILALILEHTLRRVRFGMMSALCARRERILANEVLARLLKAPVAILQGLSILERNAPGRAMEQIIAATTPTTVLSLVDVPFALLYMLVLFVMAWPLGLIALIFTVTTLLGIYFHSLELRKVTTDLQKTQSAHAAFMASASRLDTVRITNAFTVMTASGELQGGLWRQMRFLMGGSQDRMQAFLQVMTVLLTVAIVGLGAKLVVLGLIDYASLFGANFLASRMLSLIVRPAQSTPTLLQGAQALQLVEKYLELPVESDSGVKLPKYSGRFELKDLAFGFKGGQGPLFEGLSLNIAPGQLIVVTGSNGAGKTTLARMIAGLLDSTRGGMYADGVDVRQFLPSWWRQQLVYFPQEPEFIDGTLRENLRLLVPNLPDEWLKHLLQIVGLKDFVDRHPQGIDMIMTNGGHQLSLGIRRRLALVRALSTEGKLVIMDEPTEGLDSAAIQLINQLILELTKQGRTIIVTTLTPADLVKHATVIDLDAKPFPLIKLNEVSPV